MVCCVRRGHLGRGAKLRTPRFALIGSTDDFRHQLRRVRARWPSAPIVAVGVSVGTGLLARYLGEEGQASAVVGAVLNCPGYRCGDPATGPNAFANIDRRSALVSRLLCLVLRRLWLAPNRALLEAHDAEAFRAAAAARTLAALQRALFAFEGHGASATLAEKYARVDPCADIPRMAVPVLGLNSMADTLCVPANLTHEVRAFSDHPAAVRLLAVQHGGSHCVFRQGWLGRSCWSEDATVEFLDAVVARWRASLPLTNGSNAHTFVSAPNSIFSGGEWDCGPPDRAVDIANATRVKAAQSGEDQLRAYKAWNEAEKEKGARPQ